MGNAPKMFGHTEQYLEIKEVKCMDKTIVTAGGVITALGVSFAIAGELDYTLHSAYGMGGAFWTIIGLVTVGVGVRVNRKKKLEKPVRVGAI